MNGMTFAVCNQINQLPFLWKGKHSKATTVMEPINCATEVRCFREVHKIHWDYQSWALIACMWNVWRNGRLNVEPSYWVSRRPTRLSATWSNKESYYSYSSDDPGWHAALSLFCHNIFSVFSRGCYCLDEDWVPTCLQSGTDRTLLFCSCKGYVR